MDVFFEKALTVILRNEGGYANDPNDQGGETYKGISRKFHPGWEGWKIVDALSVSELEHDNELQSLVKKFYYDYYKKYNLDYIGEQNPLIFVFDATVLMGVKAIEIFQESINIQYKQTVISSDGIIGRRTINAFDNLETWSPEIYLSGLLGYLRNTKTFKHHYKGWRKRMFKNLQYIYDQD